MPKPGMPKERCVYYLGFKRREGIMGAVLLQIVRDRDEL